MYWTYVLRSLHNGRYYVGSTDDKDKRLERHNNGYVKSTKPYRPWEIAYSEPYDSRAKAFLREKEIKSWKKRNRIEKLITAHGPIV